MTVCLSVCLCAPSQKTHFQSCGDLLSKIEFLILVLDDKIFKKEGVHLFHEIVKMRDFAPSPFKHLLPEVVEIYS